MFIFTRNFAYPGISFLSYMYMVKINQMTPFSIYSFKHILGPYPVTEHLENCISDIQYWIITNKPQLNSNKTELLVLVSSYLSKHSSRFQFQIDNNLISPSDCQKSWCSLRSTSEHGESRGWYLQCPIFTYGTLGAWIPYIPTIHLSLWSMPFLHHHWINVIPFSGCPINWSNGCNRF